MASKGVLRLFMVVVCALVANFCSDLLYLWLDPRTREPALRAQLLGETRP